MAIKYLKGSDVESDSSKEKARLLGIAHELYVQRCESKGTDYKQGEYGTYYGSTLIRKKTGVDGEGNPVYAEPAEYALKIDDTKDDYTHMIGVHKAREKAGLDLENLGWDLS